MNKQATSTHPEPIPVDPIGKLVAYGLLADRPRRDLRTDGLSTSALRERWRKYLRPQETLSRLIVEMRSE